MPGFCYNEHHAQKLRRRYDDWQRAENNIVEDFISSLNKFNKYNSTKQAHTLIIISMIELQ